MLAKKFHFTAQRSLRQEFRSYRSRHFIFRERSSDLPFSRFGVVIGKSVEKKATGRNKIKRIIFDFVRLKKIYLRPGRDVLIVALSGVAGLDKKEIQVELAKLLDSQKA